MKKHIFLCLVLTLASLLCACGSTLRADVPVADLQAVVEAELANASHLDGVDADYLRFNLPGCAGAAESLIRMSVSGTTLDEYGIFRAATEAEVDGLREACEAYLQVRNDAWLNLYMVDQYPKLRDAEVKVVGQYVVYMILDESEKPAVISAIESALK